jgi:hypothetical protein
LKLAINFVGGMRLTLCSMLISVTTLLNAATSPTPEQFFRFKMGADKKLARYDKIVDYLDPVDLNPGKVVLFGIRLEHRAQTHATSPLLFNALYWSSEGDLTNTEQ